MEYWTKTLSSGASYSQPMYHRCLGYKQQPIKQIKLACQISWVFPIIFHANFIQSWCVIACQKLLLFGGLGHTSGLLPKLFSCQDG